MFISLIDEIHAKKYFQKNYIEYPKAFFFKYRAEDGRIYISMDEVLELMSYDKVEEIMRLCNTLYVNRKYVECVHD